MMKKQVAQKPETQAMRWTKAQQQKTLTRTLIVLGWVALVVLPGILPLFPSQIGDIAWKTMLWDWLGPFLMKPIPAESYPPLLQWIYWGAAGAGVFVCLCLISHLRSLHLQAVAPLKMEHSYIRLRVPANADIKGQKDGETLMSQIATLLPVRNLLQGDGMPVVFRWTGRPEQPVLQGMSVIKKSTFPETCIRLLQGVAQRAEATFQPDPIHDLIKKLQNESLWIGWADLSLALGDVYPLFIPGDRESPLIETLLPSLSPQQDIVLSEFQVMVAGHQKRDWRNRVLSLLESLKQDIGTTEQQLFKSKAKGPALEVFLRLVIIARSPEAAMSMMQTLGGSFGAAAQGYGMTQQQVVMKQMHVKPFPHTSPPQRTPAGVWAIYLLTVGSGLLLWLILAWQSWPLPLYGIRDHASLVWLIPYVLFALPYPLLMIWDRVRGRSAYREVQRIVNFVPPVQNPQTIPFM